jgi:hypothetical protein
MADNVIHGSLSLEYGAKCIRNSLFLLSRTNTSNYHATQQGSAENNVASSPNITNNSVTSNNNAAHLSSPSVQPSSSYEETNSMKQCTLVNGAYIALAMNNPVVALDYCKTLLDMKDISKQYL